MATAPTLRHLTPRQLEVLTLLAQGQSRAQIAAALELSPETVDGHRRMALHRLGLKLADALKLIPPTA